MKSHLPGTNSPNALMAAAFSLLFWAATASQANDTLADNTCTTNPQKLQATYKITNTSLTKKGQDDTSNSVELLLWRNGNNVIQQTVGAPTNQWWHKLTNGQLMLTRLFETEKRAIEYQPGDFSGKQKNNWEEKYQLLPTAFIQQLSEQEKSGIGCEKTITYTLATDTQTVNLQWLPQQQLAKSFYYKTATQETQWQLTDIETNNELIERFFNEKSSYSTMDYADIGDNESDPFVRKMIHLGFIDHGASGFYNANGSTIEGQHSH